MAEETIFAAKFFDKWRERRRQKEIQGLSADDARHKIVGRRIADLTERKHYRKIPLVTEEDQRRFKEEVNSATSRSSMEFRRSILSGFSFIKSRCTKQNINSRSQFFSD